MCIFYCLLYQKNLRVLTINIGLFFLRLHVHTEESVQASKVQLRLSQNLLTLLLTYLHLVYMIGTFQSNVDCSRLWAGVTKDQARYYIWVISNRLSTLEKSKQTNKQTKKTHKKTGYPRHPTLSVSVQWWQFTALHSISPAITHQFETATQISRLKPMSLQPHIFLPMAKICQI